MGIRRDRRERHLSAEFGIRPPASPCLSRLSRGCLGELVSGSIVAGSPPQADDGGQGLRSYVIRWQGQTVIFPRFCGHGVKQLALISRTQLEFYSREKSAVADGYRKSQDSRKYRLWPQLDSGIYDDERAPF